MLKRNRTQRTYEEKKAIINYYNSIKHEYGAKSKTVEKFDLKYVSVVDKILKKCENIDDLLENNLLSPSRKRLRKGLYPEIDNNLYRYFSLVRAQNGEVSTLDLKNKALEIAKELNINEFSASNGYIDGFKKRFNIHFKKLHGEAADVPENILIDWFQQLSSLISKYSPQNIYNLDETGLYYRAGRGKSYVTGTELIDKNLRGTKNNKERVTILVGASMSGEKLPLLMIGKSFKPRCFLGIQNLPIQYKNQQNSWMDVCIFESYLKKLDNKLCAQNQRALVIVDNCRAHPPNIQERLKNIELKFFPPNITAKAQPMDMGIIHSLKSNYKNFISQKKNYAYENGINLKISLLDAMQMLKYSWDNVSVDTIKNCFKKANFKCDNIDDLISESDNNLSITQENESFDDDDLPICEETEFKIFASTEEEVKECVEETTEDDLFDENKIPSSNDAMNALETLKTYFEQKNPNILNHLFDVEIELYKSIENSKKQTLITTFFNK